MHINKITWVIWGISASMLLSACGATSVKGINAETQSALNSTLPTVANAWVVKAPVSVPNTPWIQSFNDDLLEKLVTEALANNLNLQAQATSVDRARALSVQAGAALKPEVSLTAGATGSGTAASSSANASGGSIGLQIGWEADLWGRIRAGVQGAAASEQAVQADFVYAQYSLAASTIKAYVVAIDAKIQTDIAKEGAGILQETLRIVNVKYKNGMSDAQDLALAKSDLASAREQAITAEGSQRNALRALELLLGRYPSAEIALKNTLPAVPASPPAGIPSELLERRPDLVAAERRVAQAFNTTQAAKAARLPSLSLSADLGGSSSSLSNMLSPSNVAWQLASNLLAPIFDGGKRRAQVDIATADQKKALANYAQAALTAFGDVENALDQGSVIHNREVQLQESKSEAEKAYRIAKLQYNAGETDLLSLMQMQQRLITAKSNLASVQRLAIEQRVNLNLALGGGWGN